MSSDIAEFELLLPPPPSSLSPVILDNTDEWFINGMEEINKQSVMKFVTLLGTLRTDIKNIFGTIKYVSRELLLSAIRSVESLRVRDALVEVELWRIQQLQLLIESYADTTKDDVSRINDMINLWLTNLNPTSLY
jgi:hypothetical protein